MVAERRRLIAAALLPLASLLVVGCGSPSDTPTAQSSSSLAASSASPSPAATASSPEPVSSPASASASVSTSPSGFDRTAVPATSSGPLTGAALPDPQALGSGWAGRADPGSAEDGYTGNGTPVVARDPRDVAAALLPIGCADEAVYAVPMARPVHALEVDYVHSPSGAHGVALALDYGSEEAARSFVTRYTAALALCTGGPTGSTVVTGQAAPAGAFATVKKDPAFGTVWRELVTRTGPVVRMLAIEGSRTPVRSWSAIVAGLPPL